MVNKQREVIYAQRKEVLDKDDMRPDYIKILEEAIVNAVDDFAPEDASPEDWDLEGLYRHLLTIFPVPEDITPESFVGKDVDELERMLTQAVNQVYDRKTTELTPEMMHHVEKWAMLGAVDQHWQRHLTDLDVLREGIGLMSVAQRDPLVEYKRESFAMWRGMLDEIRTQAAYRLLTAQLARQQPPPQRRQMVRASGGGAAESRPEPVRAQHKLGRNDPCWCGSGKKYKFCHYKTDRANAG